MTVTEELFSMQDKDYKAFHEKLIPTVEPDRVIGVRTPQLRKFARDFAREERAKAFLRELPHRYYEENNLHAFVVETIKDYDAALDETKRFLPYIDNWATCDMFLPKVFKKNTERLLGEIDMWLGSEHIYTVRYAVGLLMALYLDDEFKPEYMERVAAVRSDEYYVNMMIAWYFATALAKQYDCAVKYLTDRRLSVWTHNRAIQKAVESRRISDQTKEYLKTLKLYGITR